MRIHGNLVRWNDERGFGYIAPAPGVEEIFVHISAFPRDGTRPRIDELVSCEIETSHDGTKRAVRVQRPGSRAVANRSRGAAARPSARNPVAALLGLLVVGAVGVYAHDAITPRRTSAGEFASAASAAPAAARGPGFHCDGRTHCSQMTSCAEATYFIQHCPATEMDGDNDVPCEQQWCQVDSPIR